MVHISRVDGSRYLLDDDHDVGYYPEQGCDQSVGVADLLVINVLVVLNE